MLMTDQKLTAPPQSDVESQGEAVTGGKLR